MPEGDDRRLKAKKFNEHVRLVVTTVNALAIFLLIAGFLQPLVQEPARLRGSAFVWIAWGFGLHLVAQAILRLLKDEPR
jgi:hypothetical protein